MRAIDDTALGTFPRGFGKVVLVGAAVTGTGLWEGGVQGRESWLCAEQGYILKRIHETHTPGQ